MTISSPLLQHLNRNDPGDRTIIPHDTYNHSQGYQYSNSIPIWISSSSFVQDVAELLIFTKAFSRNEIVAFQIHALKFLVIDFAS
jgi:hypothetical protein